MRDIEYTSSPPLPSPRVTTFWGLSTMRWINEKKGSLAKCCLPELPVFVVAVSDSSMRSRGVEEGRCRRRCFSWPSTSCVPKLNQNCRLPLSPSHTWPSRASGVQLSCALLCGFFLFVGAPCRPQSQSQSASQSASLLSPLSAFHLHLQRGDASLDDIDGCDSTPRGSQHVCNVPHSPPPSLSSSLSTALAASLSFSLHTIGAAKRCVKSNQNANVSSLMSRLLFDLL